MRVSLLYVVLGWSIEGAFRTQVQIALVVAGMDSGKMILDTFFLQSFYLGKMLLLYACLLFLCLYEQTR